MQKTKIRRTAFEVSAAGQTRQQMLEEASLQEKALQRLSAWEVNSATFAAFGLILGFCGLVSRFLPVWAGVLGLVAVFLSLAAAVVLHISIRNGRRNVAEIRKLASDSEK